MHDITVPESYQHHLQVGVLLLSFLAHLLNSNKTTSFSLFIHLKHLVAALCAVKYSKAVQEEQVIVSLVLCFVLDK